MNVPLPFNEAERLQALHRYNILDTPPEQAFDRITTLAARLFNVPTVLVSLVDESRAWFKSCYGFDRPEVPRNDSICNVALLCDDILVIPNAQQDDRLTCNPFVQSEPGLRFYAGAPLLTQDGYNLGTLCLLDSQPHPNLTDEQRATLTDLAAIVVDELELRRSISLQAKAERDRQQAEEIRQVAAQRLQLYADVVQNAQVGIVVWLIEDLNNPGAARLLIANPAASAITGCNFSALLGKTMAESFPYLLQSPLMEQYLGVIRTGRSLDLGEVTYAEDGITAGVYSLKVFSLPNQCVGLAFENITARKHIEAQLRESEAWTGLAIQVAQLGAWRLHLDTNLVEMDDRMRHIWNAPDDAVPVPLPDVMERIHPDDRPRVAESVALALEPHCSGSYELEYRLRWSDGTERWVLAKGQAQFEGEGEARRAVEFFGTLLDITAQKQAEIDLKASEERYRQSEARLALALRSANAGMWQWFQADNRTIWSDENFELLGYKPNECPTTYESWLRAIHPGDRAWAESAVQQALDDESPLYIEYRVCLPDGSVRWLADIGQITYDNQGRQEGMIGIQIDISQRKQVELARERSEAILTALLAASPTALALFDAELRFLYANEALARLNGVALDAHVKRTVWDVVPDVASQFAPLLQQVMATQQPILNVEFSGAVRPGLYQQTITNYFPVCLPNGEVLGAGVTITDIAELKRIETELRQSEERLSLALKAANQGLYDLNVQTGNAIVSPEYARMLGYEPDEFEETNAKWRDRMHPDDVATVYRVYEEYVAGLHPEYRVEFRQQTRTGDWVWILSIGKIVSWDEQGQPLRMLGTHTDISDRKRAEHALQQYTERLQLLYETTSDLLSTHHPQTLMDQLFYRLQSQMDLHYYYYFQVCEAEGRQYLRLRCYTGISQEQACSFESLEFGEAMCGLVAQERQQIVLDQSTIKIHPNAQIINSMGVKAYTGQPLMVHGRLLGTLSFASLTRTEFTTEEVDLLQAISEQVAIALERSELVNSLQQQTDDLAQANRVKDEFLAVLSHELRSPLNPILGWTKLLQTGKFDAHKTRQALDVIERNVKQQTQLIDDLLDISRILRGKLVLSEAPVDLAFTIESALETMRLAAEAKTIHIETYCTPLLPPVLGDAGRLQQVILNLLSNAIKFTSNGGRVVVRLERVEENGWNQDPEGLSGDNSRRKSPSPAYAQITVSDTGKGIAPDFLPYVFDSFRQEDGKTTRKFGGLGLGLAIVRQLTELHGGTVHADSAGEGTGATFTVRLPLITLQAVNPEGGAITPSSSAHEAVLSGLRVLVVDDEADMRDLVVAILEHAGASVRVAASAAEAFALVDSFQPAVIVSDIGMPHMNGYDFMRRIRSQAANRKLAEEREHSIPPIGIALTAYAMEQDQQQALAAGFQRHLSKPVEPEALVRAIATLVNRSYLG